MASVRIFTPTCDLFFWVYCVIWLCGSGRGPQIVSFFVVSPFLRTESFYAQTGGRDDASVTAMSDRGTLRAVILF